MLREFWLSLIGNCKGCIVYFHNWAVNDAILSLAPGLPKAEPKSSTFPRELALFSELFAGNIRPAKRGVPENKGSPGHTEGASLG
jgi:hypothetical protein